MIQILKGSVFLHRPWVLSKIVQFRCTHLGNTWFVVYLKDIWVHWDKKSSQAKNLPDKKKRVICDYLPLNFSINFQATIDFPAF